MPIAYRPCLNRKAFSAEHENIDVWSHWRRNITTNLAADPSLASLVWFEDVNTGEKILYGEIIPSVEELAVKWRQEFGIGPDQAVLICTHNHALYPLIAFSFLALGATVVVLPPYLHPRILHEVREQKVKLSIIHNKLLSPVQSTLASVLDTQVIPIEPTIDGLFDVSVRQLIQKPNKILQNDIEELTELRKKLNLETHCPLLFYSSGTTGDPKPILHTHKSIIDWTYAAWPGEKNDVCLETCLFGHIVGNLTFIAALNLGFQLRAFSDYQLEESLLQNIQRYQPNYLICFPKDLFGLSKYADHPDAQPLLGIKKLCFSGAPIPVSILQRVKNLMPNLEKVLNVYGSTECGCLITSEFCEPCDESVGKLVIGRELKVVDLETEKELGPLEKGEIYVKSAGMFRKYREPEDANGNAFTADGWFKTGDFGCYNDKEYVYIYNRLVDIIRVTKEDRTPVYVAPSVIEDKIISLPQVKVVAVVAEDLPDGRGQRPVAFVVKQEDSMNISEKDIFWKQEN